MIDLDDISGFDWDKGNIDKSYQKHGITIREAEELFLDEELLLFEDEEHSTVEQRFDAIGKTSGGKILFAVFTVRKNKIRVISVRIASQKERRKYEAKI